MRRAIFRIQDGIAVVMNPLNRPMGVSPQAANRTNHDPAANFVWIAAVMQTQFAPYYALMVRLLLLPSHPLNGPLERKGIERPEMSRQLSREVPKFSL